MSNGLYKKTNIDEIMQKMGVYEFSVNKDGTVNVIGSVDVPKEYTKLPVRFDRVSGSFYCANTNLITLDGSPKSVSGTFDCSKTNIRSLDGSPEYIGRSFYCNYVNISSLKGMPKIIKGDIYVVETSIDTLAGSPKVVNGLFVVSNNRYLKSLENGPEKVRNIFSCSETKITSLKGMPREIGDGFICKHIPIINFYEYRYALFSIISGPFESDFEYVDKIINNYGYDGTPESKKRVAQGLKLLKELSNES